MAALVVFGCDRTEQTQGPCIQDTAPTHDGVRVHPAVRCGLDISVSVPAACSGGGCGLILDLHGFGMDADIQDRNTQLRRLGRANGFVVAQPTGRVGLGGLPSLDIAGTDAEVIHAFALEAIEAFDLDPRRIHIGGFSQGGTVALDVACRHPDLVASAAVVATTGARCLDAGPPVPLLHVHGRRDGFVPFETARAIRDTILQGMDLPSDAGELVRGEAGISQTRYEGTGGQVYAWIEHGFAGASAGAGHCFPGSFERTLGGDGPGVASLAFGCQDPGELRIGEAMMAFYLAHPKPRPEPEPGPLP